ncbi:DASH complex subunit Spc34 [Kalaharituber pfeilii]|nr:DASH complex subunit Spc34 [Kalaharituber pfeilii]
MSSRLSPHLEQIMAASASIASQPFPPPKMFTNAILRSTDITTLIRDTESHERVLFTVPSAPSGPASGPARAPRRNTAVAAMLGRDMVEQLRKGGAGGIGGGIGGVATGEVDVEILLQGAEKLLHNYPIPGAEECVSQLRSRFIRLSNSISALETLVSNQQAQLDILHRQHEAGNYSEEEMTDDTRGGKGATEVTEEMLRREEEEIAELERKREEMEEEIKRMDLEMGRNMRGYGLS